MGGFSRISFFSRGFTQIEGADFRRFFLKDIGFGLVDRICVDLRDALSACICERVMFFSRGFTQIEGADFRGFVFEEYWFWLGGSDLR